MDKYIELAKKLKAHADRGFDGEKINAEKMLNRLLEKHGITIEDIEQDKKSDYFFNLNTIDSRLWGANSIEGKP